jgi:hypothetical protein
MNSTPRQFWQNFLLISIALSALAIYQTEQQTQALLKIRTRYKWVVVIAIFIINMGIGVFLLLRDRKNEEFWQKVEFVVTKPIWKSLGIILVIVAFPILWYAKFDFFGRAVPSFFPLMWVWLWLALIQAAGLKMLTRASWAVSFGSAILLDGILFQSWFFLQPVTDYPFSLGWSEASRFYYGSLPFSRSVYGVELPLSVWHGTRYFLLSIPFLFGSSSLWISRLWQAILWLSLNGLAAFLLVRRLGWKDLTAKLLFGAWFFLFLFQGAVYYHLLVCVIIILAGVSSRNLPRSIVAVVIASFWAGMSRLNWFPVPVMLAIAMYFLEEPLSKSGNALRYLARPFTFGALGIIFALIGQASYIAISGNQDLSAFGSSFTSALLWYRWWPSETNQLGVIPGVLLISVPLFAILVWMLRGRWNSLHPLRWFGLFALLVVLLVGGLVVSTKIGGGGDLHNMDAYIVLLGLITAYFISHQVSPEKTSPVIFPTVQWPLLAFLFMIPVSFSLSRIPSPIQYDKAQASEDLSVLRDTVQSYSRQGPVLFIYERHLLTFDMIPDVQVVPEYEVVTLTEMAISGNQPYLDRFYRDLHDHRFPAIVARRQNLDAFAGDFAEESETWNRLVASRLLCEYEPILTLNSSNIQVLVPRAVPTCP